MDIATFTSNQKKKGIQTEENEHRPYFPFIPSPPFLLLADIVNKN